MSEEKSSEESMSLETVGPNTIWFPHGAIRGSLVNLLEERLGARWRDHFTQDQIQNLHRLLQELPVDAWVWQIWRDIGVELPEWPENSPREVSRRIIKVLLDLPEKYTQLTEQRFALLARKRLEEEWPRIIRIMNVSRQESIPSLSLRYEIDFAAWAKHQADMVRLGNWEKIDQDNLAEELEALSRSEHDALESRLEVLMTHLLKWQFDTASQDPRRLWWLTIREQRRRLTRLLHRSPSLRPTLPEVINESYPHVRIMAIGETGLHETIFPVLCPWTVEQVLDDDFWPEIGSVVMS